MPLTASHLRIIVVIVVACVVINLLLYSTAVFSAARAEQLDDDTLTGSDYNTQTQNHPHRHRISSTFRFLPHGKKHKTHKIIARKGGKRKPKWYNTASEHYFGDSSAGEESGGKRREGNDGEYSRMLQNSFKKTGASSAHRYAKATGSKPGRTKTRTPSPAKASKDFNIERAVRLFEGCVAEDDQISLDCFNEAYEEMSKLFTPLGTVFSFVTSEIQEKITILRQYRQHPVHGPHFRTVQSMVQYEMDRKLTVQSDKPSGSRTFLRLQWALQFISALVTTIKDARDQGKFTDELCEAYDKTLAQHHPWLMKKAVHFAIYALPNRQEFLAKLNIRGSSAEMAQIKTLTEEMDAIYEISQELYRINRLLDLP